MVNKPKYNKVIHYCWFGGKPLPRLTKKCIESWKKFLPDYEIIEWNENNFDVNQIPFTKQAYKAKKWAFVADYARAKVLYDYGGIYFDTDMQILKPIDEFLKKPMFLGRESEGATKDMICAGVIYTRDKKNKYLKDLLDFYRKQKKFNTKSMFIYAIPRLLVDNIEKYPMEIRENNIEVFDKQIWIYPKEYFYPVNFDYTERFYSENTVMVHHYDASWSGRSREIMIRKYFPKTIARIIIKVVRIMRQVINRIKWSIDWVTIRVHARIAAYFGQNKRLLALEKNISRFNRDYLLFSNPLWMGPSSSAKYMFGDYIPLMETRLCTNREVKRIVKFIVDSGRKLIIFNGLSLGWEYIIRDIKKSDQQIIIKVLHHGGDSRLARQLDFNIFMDILRLHNKGLIDELGILKKQQADLYIAKDYRVKFLMNTVDINKLYVSKSRRSDDAVRIGLYCSGDYEWKNVFNQIAAASLIKNAELDIVPIDWKMEIYANHMRIAIDGSYTTLTNDDLLRRITANDVNLYVSFAEASPLLPLESLEMGVPCITANNHHYWTGSPLEKYLVVDRPDDEIAIYEKIEKVLANRDKIMELYAEWKLEYDKEAKRSIKEFLTISK